SEDIVRENASPPDPGIRGLGNMWFLIFFPFPLLYPNKKPLRKPLADVVKHVGNGYRMEAPEGCPSEIYDIMKQAWDLEPDNQPTFADILKRLEHLRVITD
ncbi:hypothetical protein TNIN_184651, partial [Trichonephila inaurata madagascariensis]